MNIFYEFIKYKWQAKGRHGIHSPFVYDFIENVLQKNLPTDIKLKVNSYERLLKNSLVEIDFDELGAGSKTMNDKRQISKIYNASSSRGKFGRLLFSLVNHYKFENILEFGTSLGVGTLHMHLGNPNAKITTVEGCKNTHRYTKEHCPVDGIYVSFIQNTFENFCINKELKPTELLFIDGHHDGNFLLYYLSLLEPVISDNTIILLDDIRWSKSMNAAWSKLIKDKKFHVSIDLFRMGILIKKPDQEKEHFILKY